MDIVNKEAEYIEVGNTRYYFRDNSLKGLKTGYLHDETFTSQPVSQGLSMVDVDFDKLELYDDKGNKVENVNLANTTVIPVQWLLGVSGGHCVFGDIKYAYGNAATVPVVCFTTAAGNIEPLGPGIICKVFYSIDNKKVN